MGTEGSHILYCVKYGTFFKKYVLVVAPLIVVACGVLWYVFVEREQQAPEVVVAERGVVQRLVSVSGTLETQREARLQFQGVGTVDRVHVRVGNQVSEGDVLATLSDATLRAERAEARASLKAAEATRDELRVGATDTARALAKENVTSKEIALERTRVEQGLLVKNAQKVLFSSGLVARAVEATEEATPPTISGTYTCEGSGTYRMKVFTSNSDSGYSFYLTGLESGLYEVTTSQPLAFGVCGLSANFTAGDRYTGSEWEVRIPNMESALYVANQNAYELANTNAESRVRLAELELAVARASASNTLAGATAEVLAGADAAVDQAEARLSRVEALLDERVLRAPFAGTITAVDFEVGETSSIESGITLVASGTYTVVARVPEIDVNQVMVGQSALVRFDTDIEQSFEGTITFVSPTATAISGVAYFEVRIELADPPLWLRNGLNADIDIVTAESDGTSIRLPSYVVRYYDASPYVLVADEVGVSTTTVRVELVGNDGYTAVGGIPTGTRVVTP